MTGSEFKERLLSAAERMEEAKDELTEIDSLFGDGDHGITIGKIAGEIKGSLEEYEEGDDLYALLDDLGAAIMGVNGGSAGPLWGTFIGGLALGIEEETAELGADDVKKMFAAALEEMYDISTARVGDKTMMDTLIPAVEAMQRTEGSESELFAAAAEAAEQGAKASEAFVSKFGRAKSYKEKTIGTPDAGAVSMKYFFLGLSEV
ncbi:DAK2 domain-containing protein [Bacilliculturomica massiliensis]|uniref:DAK2 domain-containing protein n=1 Tax=Bacilliculturomica massiliensis TaxID=1917867 RepID=UPI0010320DC0|nr:DAK2 domain-containing protein [Bacilliculturomica massiliensis]